jgi:hypothetical protein
MFEGKYLKVFNAEFTRSGGTKSFTPPSIFQSNPVRARSAAKSAKTGWALNLVSISKSLRDAVIT